MDKKRIAITSVFANLTYNDKNHRGLEAMFFKKMMEDKGAEVDVKNLNGVTPLHMAAFGC